MARKGSKIPMSRNGEKKYKVIDSKGRTAAIWAKDSEAARKKASRLGYKASSVKRIWRLS